MTPLTEDSPARLIASFALVEEEISTQCLLRSRHNALHGMFEFDLLVVDWRKRELSTGWNVQHGKVPSGCWWGWGWGVWTLQTASTSTQLLTSKAQDRFTTWYKSDQWTKTRTACRVNVKLKYEYNSYYTHIYILLLKVFCLLDDFTCPECCLFFRKNFRTMNRIQLKKFRSKNKDKKIYVKCVRVIIGHEFLNWDQLFSPQHGVKPAAPAQFSSWWMTREWQRCAMMTTIWLCGSFNLKNHPIYKQYKTADYGDYTLIMQHMLKKDFWGVLIHNMNLIKCGRLNQSE